MLRVLGAAIGELSGSDSILMETANIRSALIVAVLSWCALDPACNPSTRSNWKDGYGQLLIDENDQQGRRRTKPALLSLGFKDV